MSQEPEPSSSSIALQPASSTANQIDNDNNENTNANDIDGLSTNIAYDEDDLPIPQGIEEVDEKELKESTGESLFLDLNKTNKNIWLVKLPPYLSELWKSEEFLDGRLLGNIRIEKNSQPKPNGYGNGSSRPNSSDSTKIFLELNKDIEDQKSLPNEFELKMTKQIVENEYIFSETELDHFKHRLMQRTEVAQMPFQPKLRSLNKDSQNHAAKWSRKIRTDTRQRPESGIGTTIERKIPGKNGKFGKAAKFQKKFIPYAKTIPKKTEIIGKVAHECQAVPTNTMNDYSLKLLDNRKKLKAMSAGKKIKFMNNTSVGVLQSRAGPNIHSGATITLSRELAAKKEASKQEGRSARMERDELMKLLFSMFNSYEYWSMKGIKERTNQPEAFLKECLDTIAVLERKGTYSLKYRLKDEYKKSREVERKAGDDDMEVDENANGIQEEEDDDEDFENMEMEDVA